MILEDNCTALVITHLNTVVISNYAKWPEANGATEEETDDGKTLVVIGSFVTDALLCWLCRH